jgi:hypothetical protein
MSEFAAMGELDRHPIKQRVRKLKADYEDLQDQMMGLEFEDP